jgi:hypothetical protein
MFLPHPVLRQYCERDKTCLLRHKPSPNSSRARHRGTPISWSVWFPNGASASIVFWSSSLRIPLAGLVFPLKALPCGSAHEQSVTSCCDTWRRRSRARSKEADTQASMIPRAIIPLLQFFTLALRRRWRTHGRGVESVLTRREPRRAPGPTLLRQMAEACASRTFSCVENKGLC